MHVYPDEGINTLDDWKENWEGKRITDEYGDVITEEEMLANITERNRPGGFDHKPHFYESWDDFHSLNHSEFGPNGLLRHRIDSFCIGHGEGTWDYSDREFS